MKAHSVASFCQWCPYVARLIGGRASRASSLLQQKSGRSVMLARRPELHVRPALLHQAQVHPRRCEVGQVPAAVDSQVLVGLVAELLELLLVGAIDPACGPDVDRL